MLECGSSSPVIFCPLKHILRYQSVRQPSSFFLFLFFIKKNLPNSLTRGVTKSLLHWLM